MGPSRAALQAQSDEDGWRRFFDSSANDLGADIVELIDQDRALETRSLNMIASASYCPLGLRQIEGTHLVNRAPMGLPGRRTVANCEQLDAIENLAIGRAKAVFGAEYVNVQALSSTIANVAVLRALLPADGARLLVFDELAGGHVSHGAMRHITGYNREVASFGVTAAGTVDLDQAREQACKIRPHLLIAGPSSYPREIDFAALRAIADEVGALLFTDIAHVAGLIAAGLHANPVPFSDVSTTSTQKTLCGPRNGAFVFARERFGATIDAAIYPGLQGPAAANLIAARAVQMEMIARPAFADLMRDIVANAKALAAGLQEGGIDLYTGGTDSHMVMAYTGERWTASELVARLGAYGILGNAMRAPGRSGEPRTAFRLGSIALTIRGLDVGEFRQLGRDIASIFTAGPETPLDRARLGRLKDLAAGHPIPSFVD
jgi:glycine hydroxymethyltransferase